MSTPFDEIHRLSADLADARAALATARAELDAYRYWRDDGNPLPTDRLPSTLVVLEREVVEQVKAAIQSGWSHTLECGYNSTGCVCGKLAALATLEGATK